MYYEDVVIFISIVTLFYTISVIITVNATFVEIKHILVAFASSK